MALLNTDQPFRSPNSKPGGMMKALFATFFILDTAILGAQTAPQWTWANNGGGASYDYGYAIAAAADGKSYVAGSFSGTATFGDSIWSTSSASDADIVVGRIAPDGSWLWAVNSGSAATMEGYGIASSSAGYILTGMYMNAAAQFGATSLPQLGECDMFIARLAFNIGPPIPLPPQNLVISISDSTVTLAWDPVMHDTTGQPVTIHHYNVYRTSDLAAGFGSVGNTFTTSWTGSADAYERRFYRVTAVTE